MAGVSDAPGGPAHGKATPGAQPSTAPVGERSWGATACPHPGLAADVSGADGVSCAMLLTYFPAHLCREPGPDLKFFAMCPGPCPSIKAHCTHP